MKNISRTQFWTKIAVLFLPDFMTRRENDCPFDCFSGCRFSTEESAGHGGRDDPLTAGSHTPRGIARQFQVCSRRTNMDLVLILLILSAS